MNDRAAATTGTIDGRKNSVRYTARPRLTRMITQAVNMAQAVRSGTMTTTIHRVLRTDTQKVSDWVNRAW